MHFVAPLKFSNILDSLLSSNLSTNYPYWLGGQINWVAQSYLVLREYRENISLTTAADANKINFAHVNTWRSLPRTEHEYRVSIRADYRRLYDVDFEILQNPKQILTLNQAYITYWPIPGLKPRDANRNGVDQIAYAGRFGNRNIDSSFHRVDNLKNIRFKIIEKEQWHDMSNIDILIAIREFSKKPFNNKPPSKLINAWFAGIPLIAGYDSAYSAIGTPGVDYISVQSESELYTAISQLCEDPDYYQSIVDAGRRRSLNFTREMIAMSWLSTMDNLICPHRDSYQQKSTGRQFIRTMNRSLDRTIGLLSKIKNIHI